MLTQQHKADRRRALQALAASAVAVALTVSLTSGIAVDPGVPSLPGGFSFSD